MQTPIDFGKEFLEDFYRQRDVEKSAAYFGEDVIWVSPTSIHHFMTHKEIEEYIAENIKGNPEPHKVDIISIKRAVTTGPVNNITYELNLIPREVENSLYLRCMMSIYKNGLSSQVIAALHISGQHQQTKARMEQELQGLKDQLAQTRAEYEEQTQESERLREESDRALQEQADRAEEVIQKLKEAAEEQAGTIRGLMQDVQTLREAGERSAREAAAEIARITQTAVEREAALQEEAAAREEAIKQESQKYVDGLCRSYDERIDKMQQDFDQKEREFDEELRKTKVRLQETQMAVEARDNENKRLEAIRSEERKREQAAIDQLKAESEVDRKARTKTMQRMMAGVRGVVGNSLDLQAMLDDVAAIGEAAYSHSGLRSEEFSLDSCMATVRRLTKAKCRARGQIFNYKKAPHMPERFVGDKAKLQLVLLNILENAVENTFEGGTVTLSCSADAPVRDKVYAHFTVEDTGDGIAEEDLLTIFDNPTGDLAISKELVRRMGGGIQVRTHAGMGTAFEITVLLRCAGASHDFR